MIASACCWQTKHGILQRNGELLSRREWGYCDDPFLQHGRRRSSSQYRYYLGFVIAKDMHLHRKPRSRMTYVSVFSNDVPLSPDKVQQDAENSKKLLFQKIALARKNPKPTDDMQSSIEEAQILVESLSDSEVNWNLLMGIWWVQYSTAPDVSPLLEGRNENWIVSIGRVGQRFSDLETGKVENIIELKLKDPIIGESRVFLVVEASFEVATARSISLRFQSASLKEFKPSETLVDILSTPIFPRGWWTLFVLQSIVSARVDLFKFPSQLLPGDFTGQRGNYNITYLDDEVLIGRASNGTFVFKRDAKANMNFDRGIL